MEKHILCLNLLLSCIYRQGHFGNVRAPAQTCALGAFMTTTNRNKKQMVDNIKHIYLFYCQFKKTGVKTLKTYCKAATNHLDKHYSMKFIAVATIEADAVFVLTMGIPLKKLLVILIIYSHFASSYFKVWLR